MDTITLDTGEVLDLAAYPLPEGVEDETFNLDQLARAMNTSLVTIKRWIDDGMPVLKRGGHGQSYEMQFSHCYAWRMWRQDQSAAERRSKDDKAAQLAMLFLNPEGEIDDDAMRMSPKEYKEHIEAELARNRAAELRGELVRRSGMQEVLDHMLVSYRNALIGFPDWLEQEFNLTPKQVAKAQDFCDGILGETRRQIREAGFVPADVVPIGDRRSLAQGDDAK